MGLTPGAMRLLSMIVTGLVGDGRLYIAAQAYYVNDMLGSFSILKRSGDVTLWQLSADGSRMDRIFSDTITNADVDKDGKVDDVVLFSRPEGDRSRCVYVAKSGAKLRLDVQDITNLVEIVVTDAAGNEVLNTGLVAMRGQHRLNVAIDYMPGAEPQPPAGSVLSDTEA